jgi:hypothetical protein
MKKFIRFALIAIVGLFLLLLTAPFLFQDKIKALVQEEIDNTVNAEVYFGQVGLSFIRNFPNARISLDDFGVINREPFAGDTLAAGKSFALVVDLMSVIVGDEISLKKVILDDAQILVQVLEDGTANYDIAMADSTTQVEADTTTEEPSNFAIALEAYEVNRARIIYDDATLPMRLAIEGLNHQGSGDFTAEAFDLRTQTQAQALTAIYDGVAYLTRTQVDAAFNANITVRDTMVIALRDNQFTLNGFTVGMAGLISMWEEDMDFDLTYQAQRSDFRSLMSLVPAVYTEDFEGLSIDGGVAFDGYVKGRMTETLLPGFGLNLAVDNGKIQYPDLPQAIKAILVGLKIDYPGGEDFESLAIDLEQMHAELGVNPLDMKLKMKGLERIALEGMAKTDLDLASLTQMVPMEGTTVQGQFKLDATFDGIYDEAAGTFPTVDAVMDLSNGYVKDAAYPAELSELSFRGELTDADGALTSAALDVPRFHFLLDGEPMDGSLRVENFDNPSYVLRANGQLDLDKLMQVYPIDSMTLGGKILVESFETRGTYAAIEEERYTDLPTSGSMRMQNLVYADPETPETVIESGTLIFNPDRMDITEAKGKIGRSDFQLDGAITNYLGYALLEGQTLGGDLRLSSQLIDVNELMMEEESAPSGGGGETVEAPAGEVPPEVIPVPEGLDVVFRTDIAKVLYDNLTLSNLTGTMRVVNQEVDMENLQFDLLDGRVAMNGLYNTENIREPLVNFYLNVAELSIPKAFQSFVTIQQIAPALEKVNGVVNTEFGISGPLDREMNPKLEMLDGLGKFQVLRGQLAGTPLLSAISEKTKLAKLTPIDLKDLQGSFQIEDGYLIVSPLDLKAGNTTLTLGGRQSLAGQLDYTVTIDAPTGQVGQAAVSALNNLAGTSLTGSDRMKLELAVGGTSTQPRITGVGGGGGTKEAVKDELANRAGEALQDQTGVDVNLDQDSLKKEAERIKQDAQDSLRRAVEARKQQVADSLAKATEEAKKKAEEKVKDEAKDALEDLKNKFGLPGKKKKNKDN